MGGGSGSAGGTSGRVRVRVRVRVLDRCVGLPCGGLLLPVGLLAGCGLRGEVRGPLLGCEVEAGRHTWGSWKKGGKRCRA